MQQETGGVGHDLQKHEREQGNAPDTRQELDAVYQHFQTRPYRGKKDVDKMRYAVI
jgi:hypothetical protein